jgi:hypothetical protein
MLRRRHCRGGNEDLPEHNSRSGPLDSDRHARRGGARRFVCSPRGVDRGRGIGVGGDDGGGAPRLGGRPSSRTASEENSRSRMRSQTSRSRDSRSNSRASPAEQSRARRVEHAGSMRPSRFWMISFVTRRRRQNSRRWSASILPTLGESIGSYARNVRLDWAAGVIAYGSSARPHRLRGGLRRPEPLHACVRPAVRRCPRRYRQTHG